MIDDLIINYPFYIISFVGCLIVLDISYQVIKKVVDIFG
jgi:hypothetical protein